MLKEKKDEIFKREIADIISLLGIKIVAESMKDDRNWSV